MSYKCPKCGTPFPNPYLLKDHIKTQHPDTCDIGFIGEDDQARQEPFCGTFGDTATDIKGSPPLFVSKGLIFTTYIIAFNAKDGRVIILVSREKDPMKDLQGKFEQRQRIGMGFKAWVTDPRIIMANCGYRDLKRIK
jgi:hypothetical protein